MDEPSQQPFELQPLEVQRDAKPVVAQVGSALRMARRRRGLSQREFAQKIGVSKSRFGRLESDAGPQSLEMVVQVLMASGYRLDVVDTSGTERQEDVSLATLLELCDVSGRRFPAHLDAYRLAYPPTYWFVRNGGWTTSKPFPQWTFERRYVRRSPPRRRLWDEYRPSDQDETSDEVGTRDGAISPGRESSS